MQTFLQKCFASTTRSQQFVMAASQRGFATVAPHSRMPRETDYYKILGVGTDATPEQIKDAYREAVKRSHPDVAGSTAPDSTKFREVNEAYAILSSVQARASYDLTRMKNPDAFTEISQREFDKMYNPGARDETGNVPIKAAAPGSYAAERLAELKEQREQYNANHLGFYRGGVPVRGKGAVRGTSMGRPGGFH